MGRLVSEKYTEKYTAVCGPRSAIVGYPHKSGPRQVGMNSSVGLEHLPEWHRLTFWAGAAETVEKYLRKGNRLYVEGRVEYGTYDRDGVTIPTTDVIVDDFVFLDGTPNGDTADFPEATSDEFETV